MLAEGRKLTYHGEGQRTIYPILDLPTPKGPKTIHQNARRIAVNISTDLSMFSNIIPCGLQNARMISLKKLGVNITFNEFDSIIKEEFVNIF